MWIVALVVESSGSSSPIAGDADLEKKHGEICWRCWLGLLRMFGGTPESMRMKETS